MQFLITSLTVLLLCGPLTCLADTGIYNLAETGIYKFVDEQGGLHLSNIPDDKRYQLLIAPLVSAVAETRDASANADFRPQYSAVVEQVASQFGIEAALLHAVITVESGYNPRAISKRGAVGLMQLMPQTARRFGVADSFDPADNVRGGAQYLAELLKLFDNDLQLTLAAYNAGENAVLKYGKRVPPYRETAAYVPKVVDFYQRYRTSM